MLPLDFEAYVSEICKGIKSKPKREEIMEELLCHLEDNLERNLATGMTEEEARLNAIKKMGDGENLSFLLSEVHSHSPVKEMNSVLVGIIIGFGCLNFIFSGAFKQVIGIIGICILFMPLLRMRKMNRKAEKAFHFFNFFALTQLFYYCISIGNILPSAATIIYIVLNFLFKGVFWFFLFSGLNEASEKYLDEEAKKPRLILCGVFYMLLSFLTGGILVLSEGETVNFNDFIAPFVLVFMFIYTIVQLVRTKNILWNADSEYGILPADRKHIIIYDCALLFCVATVLAFNYASATRAPVKTELFIHDVSVEEQTEADKVRQKLLSWDVDPQIIEDLPDSEILNYKDAAFVTWGADGGSMGGSTYDNGTSSDVYYYWFFIPDKEYEGDYEVRLLCYIESNYSDSVKHFYRKGFYYTPWDNVVPLNTGENLNGSFISIVTDENGKKLNSEPFFTYNLGDDYVLDWPKGFEYKEEKGQRVYYAVNVGVQNLDYDVTINTSTMRKRWFFTFKYNTTADFAESIMDYGRQSYPNGDYIPFYWRNHNIITGNFSNDDIENMLNRSIEYDGYYIKQ